MLDMRAGHLYYHIPLFSVYTCANLPGMSELPELADADMLDRVD